MTAKLLQPATGATYGFACRLALELAFRFWTATVEIDPFANAIRLIARRSLNGGSLLFDSIDSTRLVLNRLDIAGEAHRTAASFADELVHRSEPWPFTLDDAPSLLAVEFARLSAEDGWFVDWDCDPNGLDVQVAKQIRCEYGERTHGATLRTEHFKHAIERGVSAEQLLAKIIDTTEPKQ